MRISVVPTLVLMVFYVSTFRRMCAVPNMTVFCSFRTSWLPGMLPTYFLNLLLLLLTLALPPLYRVFTRMSPRQTMSLGIHCCSYSFVLLSIRCVVHFFLVSTLVLTVFYVIIIIIVIKRPHDTPIYSQVFQQSVFCYVFGTDPMVQLNRVLHTVLSVTAINMCAL